MDLTLTLDEEDNNSNEEYFDPDEEDEYSKTENFEDETEPEDDERDVAARGRG